MDSALLYELLGYVASIIVAISLTMRSVLRLRLINLVGSACFSVYGLLIGAVPVAALNGLIVLINIYYLVEMKRKPSFFSVLEVEPESAYLQEFLRFYEQDIRRFFPDFHYRPEQSRLTWLVLRDLVPVGLFLARQEQGGCLLVELDYVIPGYRDLQPGRFLYRQQAPRLKGLGIERICAEAGTPEHRAYIQRMGFIPNGSSDGSRYCLSLSD